MKKFSSQLSWLSLAALASAACGGSSSSNNTVVGQLGTASIPTVNNAGAVISQTAVVCGAVTYGVLLDVDLSTVASVCNELTSATTPKSATDLNLVMVELYTGTAMPIPTAPPIVAGTYNIGTNSTSVSGYSLTVSAELEAEDASCDQIAPSPYNATSGTITITAIGGGNVSGTYSATFAQGSLTGVFNTSDCGETAAEVCNAIESNRTCGP